MKIDININEYAQLLDLLYIADSVLSAHKAEDDPRIAKYAKIVQKFYGLAKEMEQGEKIVYDSDLEKYVPAKALEELSEARIYLDEFADETFWHELIYRFSERDLERRAGGYDKLHALTPDKRFDLETSIEEKYLDEFENHGIDRLEVVESFSDQGVKLKTSD